MRCGRDAGEQGFSLVEVLVATTVLVVGLVALAQLFTVATLSNLSASQTTHATVLAAQKLEELRSLALLARGQTPPWGLTPLEDRDRVGAYTRRWDVAPLPRDPDNTIVIQVSVRHPTSPSREARLVTLLTRRAGDAD